MKNKIIQLILTAIIVLVLSKILPGVTVDSYVTAIFIAVALAILNVSVKPLLVLFTLPATIFTFGLFLLVINALILLISDYFIDGFSIASFVSAFIFSLVLTISQSIVFSIVK